MRGDNKGRRKKENTKRVKKRKTMLNSETFRKLNFEKLAGYSKAYSEN